MRLADSLKLEDLSHKKIKISLDYAPRDPKNICVKSSILNCGKKFIFYPTFKSTTILIRVSNTKLTNRDHLTVLKELNSSLDNYSLYLNHTHYSY